MRRVLLTGGSSGIGAATARLLASDGCEVWLTYAHDADRAHDVADACGARCTQVDLRDSAAVRGWLAQVDAKWGAAHVLVNNGGVCPYTAWDAIDDDEWDAVLETNLRGVYVTTRAAIPLLRAADGDRAIVNLASLAGQAGGVSTSVHYAASKGGVLAMTRTLARLLAPESIRVNAVSPGPIETQITAHLTDDARTTLEQVVPLRRLGAPKDVARVVALLASPQAAFTTGATYDVNGGLRID